MCANLQAPTDKPITVLIVDDHPVVRQGLCGSLARHSRVRVVGEAADGKEALAQAKRLKPDVALMDIELPEVDGLSVTELLRKENPEIKVILVSVHNPQHYGLRIIESGARGYVSKDTPPEEFVKAIQAVAGGGTVFGPEIARLALSQLVRCDRGGEPLSPREREVLAGIAEGLSNKEVATRLGVSVRTVETHRERIMRKLNIRSVAGLTKFAIAKGLVALPEEPL